MSSPLCIEVVHTRVLTMRLSPFPATQLGSTTIGISTPHGVILGVEKRVQSSLLEATSIEKIMEIDTHLGCALSGLTADARTMIEHARVTSQVSVARCTECACCSLADHTCAPASFLGTEIPFRTTPSPTMKK